MKGSITRISHFVPPLNVTVEFLNEEKRNMEVHEWKELIERGMKEAKEIAISHVICNKFSYEITKE